MEKKWLLTPVWDIHEFMRIDANQIFVMLVINNSLSVRALILTLDDASRVSHPLLMRNWCASTTYLWTGQIRISTYTRSTKTKKILFSQKSPIFRNLRSNIWWNRNENFFFALVWQAKSFSLADFHQEFFLLLMMNKRSLALTH